MMLDSNQIIMMMMNPSLKKKMAVNSILSIICDQGTLTGIITIKIRKNKNISTNLIQKIKKLTVICGTQND